MHRRSSGRRGKVLLFVVVALPAILTIIGLIYDSGLMATKHLNLRSAADAAATAAATELSLGKSASAARSIAEEYLNIRNDLPEAAFQFRSPPQVGPFAGNTDFVEILADVPYDNVIMQSVGAASRNNVSVRAVAGRIAATAGAAVVVLDPDPPPIQIVSIPLILPVSFPAILGGLEILGLGTMRVDGSVLVNTNWGGVDEDRVTCGIGPGPPYAISCTPLLPLTRLNARDIWTVGGVDNPKNFSNFVASQPPPLKANRSPVPDPFKSLPVPTTSSAPSVVDATLRGSVTVVQLPLISAPKVLSPGVYEWIEILSGNVIFQPGVYIIRGANPITKAALVIAGGIVKADGVLFYITNSSTFDAASGSPDSSDANAAAAPPGTLSLFPSAVISGALPGSSFSPLGGTGTALDGMLIYQRRNDYRPIVVVYQNLIGSPKFDGTIYAKNGHFTFVGDGVHDLRVVAGSARFVPLLGLTLTPPKLLPPAYSVFLVE